MSLDNGVVILPLTGETEDDIVYYIGIRSAFQDLIYVTEVLRFIRADGTQKFEGTIDEAQAMAAEIHHKYPTEFGAVLWANYSYMTEDELERMVDNARANTKPVED